MAEETTTEAVAETTEPTGIGGEMTSTPETVETQTTQGFSDSADSFKQFVETLPDDLKGSQTLQQTQDFKSLASQLVNAQGALGKKRLEAPQPDWTEEQYQEYYKNVRPENDEYSIPEEFNFAKDESYQGKQIIEMDDQSTQELVDFAGAIGLNQQQFDAMYERFVQFQTDGVSSVNVNANQAIKDAKVGLQTEWGSDFDVRIQNGRETFEVLSQEIPELNQLVADPVVANHPGVLKLFDKLAPLVKDSLPVSGSNVPSAFGTETVAGIRGEIADLDTSNSDLIMTNPSSLSLADRAKREKLLEKRTSLYQKLYGQG